MSTQLHCNAELIQKSKAHKGVHIAKGAEYAVYVVIIVETIAPVILGNSSGQLHHQLALTTCFVTVTHHTAHQSQQPFAVSIAEKTA